MGETVKRSLAEVQREIEQQEKRLKKFCLHYDQGDLEFASEIATKLRLLLHQTKFSHALLKQLFDGYGVDFENEVPFISTCIPYQPEEMSTAFIRSRLVQREFTHDGREEPGVIISKPILNNYQNSFWEPFLFWWERDQIVLFDDHTSYSRKDVVRSLCDQLGGAHYDPEVDEKIYRLIHNMSRSLTIEIDIGNGKTKKMTCLTQTELGCIVRQIAQETLIMIEHVVKYYIKKHHLPGPIYENMKSNLA